MDWIKKNLFSSFGNGVITLLTLFTLYHLLVPVVKWLIFDAQFTGTDPELCNGIEGACWPFINEKYRLILFGRFPYEEQWRALIGIFILLGMIVASCFERMWHPRLFLIWVVGLIFWSILMSGGVFGLSSISNNLWGGLPLTLILTVVGLITSFPIAILLALGRRSNLPGIKVLCVIYIEFIRGVPLIAVLFMGSVLIPLFFPAGITVDEVLRAQIVITMFAAAYLAEIIRGGLQAIPKGQYEAAESLGLSYWSIQRKVILPQALTISIPSIVGNFIALFKDTSLVAIIGLSDLLFSVRIAIDDSSWRSFFVEGYLFVAAIYFIFCFLMSKYSRKLETKFKRSV